MRGLPPEESCDSLFFLSEIQKKYKKGNNTDGTAIEHNVSEKALL